MWHRSDRRRPIRPPSSNPVQQLQTPALRNFLHTVAAASLLWLVLPLAVAHVNPVGLMVSLTAATVVIAAHLLAIVVLRRGYFRHAVLLSAASFMIAAFMLLVVWGVNGVGAGLGLIHGITISIVLVGLLADRRALLVTTIAALGGILFVSGIEATWPSMIGFVAPNDDIHLLIIGTFLLSTIVIMVLLLEFSVTIRALFHDTLVREAELIHTRTVLQARTAELEQSILHGHDLEAQLREAQKLESIGTLAGGIAHDFNNLLTVVLGNTSLASADLPAEHPVQTTLQSIAQTAHRASMLTKQLLAFARRQTMHPRILDINHLIERIDRLIVGVIGETIKLTLHLSPDVGQVCADPNQIEQIVINLIINARDAMPQGGTLTIETRNVRDADINQPGIGPGAYVLLAIHDTGSGMDEATRERIFEPFFTTKAPGHGTGLGLSMCYGIVTHHGGYIAVTSSVGVGSTFSIYLPHVRVDVAIEEASSPDTMPVNVDGGEVILVVEDDADVRHLMSRALAAYGYTVVMAGNGVEALHCVQHWSADRRIDLLVTDIVMPDLQGTSLAEHLLAIHPWLKVVFVSGYVKPTVEQEWGHLKRVRLLNKPFTVQSLLQCVRNLLDAEDDDGV